MRTMLDVYEMWIPLVLSLSILACGFMLGCIWKGSRAGTE